MADGDLCCVWHLQQVRTWIIISIDITFGTYRDVNDINKKMNFRYTLLLELKEIWMTYKPKDELSEFEKKLQPVNREKKCITLGLRWDVHIPNVKTK